MPDLADLVATSHQRTVAALIYFGAVEREVSRLLRDPLLGEYDLSPLAAEAVQRMTAHDDILADNAAEAFRTFPAEVFNQREWLERTLEQTVKSSIFVLERHAEVSNQHRALEDA